MRATPAWLLIVSFVYAPWAYGCVRPWALEGLDGLLGGVLSLWILSCVLDRRWPALSIATVLPACALLAQGWWMAFNAHSTYDPDLDALLPLVAPIPRLPGTADGPATVSAMLSMSGLLGAFLFCCELARAPVWRRRLTTALALAGVSIAVWGLAQKIGGAPMLSLLWEPAKRDVTNNFATFRYRGNAGAYLDLVLPLVAVRTVLAFRSTDRPWRRAFWSAGLFIVVLGIQLNPSRSGWLVALAIGVVLAGFVLVLHRRRALDRRVELNRGRVVMLTVATTFGVAAILGICFLGDWETSWQRAAILGLNPAERAPTAIYLEMIPKAGFFGFGPGTFQSVFSSFQDSHDFGGRTVPQFWRDGIFVHAHEDFLETAIEWGWLGASLWTVLVAGGIARAVRGFSRAQASTSERWRWLGNLLALGGVLALALIDFPLQIPAIQLNFLALLGLCWGTTSPSAVPRERSEGARRETSPSPARA